MVVILKEHPNAVQLENLKNWLGNLVYAMSMAAAAAGADGLMIEVYNDPRRALCDGPQSLTPERFAEVARGMRSILPYCKYSCEK